MTENEGDVAVVHHAVPVDVRPADDGSRVKGDAFVEVEIAVAVYVDRDRRILDAAAKGRGSIFSGSSGQPSYAFGVPSASVSTLPLVSWNPPSSVPADLLLNVRSTSVIYALSFRASRHRGLLLRCR